MSSTPWGSRGAHREAWGKGPLHGCHVSSGIELGKPTHFTVNAKAAGKGKLDVQFTGLAKGDVARDVDIIDHHDNTYTVKYTPVQQVAALTSQQPRSSTTHTEPVGLLVRGLAGLLPSASYTLLIPTRETASVEGWGRGSEASVSLTLPPCPSGEGTGRGDQGPHSLPCLSALFPGSSRHQCHLRRGSHPQEPLLGGSVSKPRPQQDQGVWPGRE